MAEISGVGSCLPEKVLTNADLAQMVETTDEWIRTRTGIRERRIAEPGVTVSDLAAGSGLAAIKDAGLDPSDIDLILVASGSPEMVWPSTACLTQKKLGISGSPAFDLQAACTGFSYGLSVADAMIGCAGYSNVLVIGAEVISRLVDWNDRSTCVLFGDGAGAVVLRPAEPGYGILANHMAADGGGAELLKVSGFAGAETAGEKAEQSSAQTIKMNGNEVFKFAVKTLPDSVETVLLKARVAVDEVDYFVFHQANQRIIKAATERLGVAAERVIGNIDKYGNTSAASIPLILDEIYRDGRLKRGDIIVTAAFGAGFTWGANVIRWSKDKTMKLKAEFR